MFGKKRDDIKRWKVALFLTGVLFLIGFGIVSAAPIGPDSVAVSSNETKGDVASYEINVSGGYITTLNLTSRTQNPRWKAMVGRVFGSFTLDDASGSTIFDWSLATISGEVYATRNSSTPDWLNIQCADSADLETENTLLEHTNPGDNLTATFNTTAGATHAGFVVASVSIPANGCPTLNTYVNNETQDSVFEEVVLTDEVNLIYSTPIEQAETGFDGEIYDFQMIVPENGNSTFTGATAYYLYVELS